MKYAVPQDLADKLNQAVAPRYFFARDEGGVLVHDTDVLDTWPIDDAPDFDQLVRDLGVANSYAELLSTLSPAKDRRCKIYDFLGDVTDRPDDYTPPLAIDYRVAPNPRLHRKQTFSKGVLVRVTYYAEATVQPDGTVAYNDPVVEEVYDYVRDAANFALERTLTITWFRADGTPHPTTKKLRKVYDRQASLREGKRRRRNVVDSLQGMVARLLVGSAAPGQEQAALDQGRAFMGQYQKEIVNFVEAGLPDLANAVAVDTTAFLDVEIAPGVTVRDNILDELS